jgi:hypothetical protein
MEVDILVIYRATASTVTSQALEATASVALVVRAMATAMVAMVAARALVPTMAAADSRVAGVPITVIRAPTIFARVLTSTK